MAEKRAVTTKTAAKPTKSVEKPQELPGYVCRVRGLSVPVDESCGCVQFCDVECYGTPATRRTSKANGTVVRIVGDS